MALHDRFNSTGFSRWVNSHQGRAFRIVAGLAWLIFAVAFRDHWWAVAAGVWSFFPLTAGAFDICWVSATLGGPLSGRTIRADQDLLGSGGRRPTTSGARARGAAQR